MLFCNSIDIFGLCETFLNDTIDNNLVHINGYKIERKDKHKTDSNPSGKGVGILIYIAEHINSLIRIAKSDFFPKPIAENKDNT